MTGARRFLQSLFLFHAWLASRVSVSYGNGGTLRVAGNIDSPWRFSWLFLVALSAEHFSMRPGNIFDEKAQSIGSSHLRFRHHS